MEHQSRLVVIGALGVATVALCCAIALSRRNAPAQPASADKAPSSPSSSLKDGKRAAPSSTTAGTAPAPPSEGSGVSSRSKAPSSEGGGAEEVASEAAAGADGAAGVGAGAAAGAAGREDGDTEEGEREALIALFNEANAVARRCFKEQRYGKAAEQYGVALSLCDKLPNHESKRTALHNNRGAAFEKDGKHALALVECSICLARETGHPLARVRKSRVLEALGKPVDALAEVCAHLLLERDRVQAKAAASPSQPITPPTPPANLEGLLQKVAAARADEVLLEREQLAAKKTGRGEKPKAKPLMKQAVTELLRSFGSFSQLERRYNGVKEAAVTQELQGGVEDGEGKEGDGSSTSPSFPSPSPSSAAASAAASPARVSSLLDRCLVRLVKLDYEGSREDAFEAGELLAKLKTEATTGETGVPSDVEAGVWEWQGTYFQLVGELDEAMKAYERCGARLEAEGEAMPPDVLIKMAWVHMDKENSAMAKTFFSRAMEVAPEYGTTYAHRARLDAESEGLDAVKGFLDKAIELNNKDVFAWEQLGRMHVQTGDVNKAMETAIAGLKASPKAEALLTLKAELMYSLAVRGGDASATPGILDLFDEAIKASPSSPLLYMNKASFLLQMMADVGGAMETLEKAVEVDTTSVSALVQLANLKIMVAKSMEDAEKATSLLDKAVVLCTTRDELIETLSVLVATEGRIKGALLLGRTSLG